MCIVHSQRNLYYSWIWEDQSLTVIFLMSGFFDARQFKFVESTPKYFFDIMNNSKYTQKTLSEEILYKCTCEQQGLHLRSSISLQSPRNFWEFSSLQRPVISLGECVASFQIPRYSKGQYLPISMGNIGVIDQLWQNSTPLHL